MEWLASTHAWRVLGPCVSILLLTAFGGGGDDPVPGPGLTVPRGDGGLPLHIPQDETLEFDVVLRLGLLPDTKVGEFKLSAGVEPYLPGLTATVEASAPERYVGFIKSHAGGRYLAYELDHSIEMRALPQAWPRVIYRDTQKGSENRRREVKYGVKDGGSASEYRSDKHCRGCNRREHFIEGTWFTQRASLQEVQAGRTPGVA